MPAQARSPRSAGTALGSDEKRLTDDQLEQHQACPHPDFTSAPPLVTVRLACESFGRIGVADGDTLNDREERNGVFEAGALFSGLEEGKIGEYGRPIIPPEKERALLSLDGRVETHLGMEGNERKQDRDRRDSRLPGHAEVERVDCGKDGAMEGKDEDADERADRDVGDRVLRG